MLSLHATDTGLSSSGCEPLTLPYPFLHLGGERQCGAKFLIYENNTTEETMLEPPTTATIVKNVP